MTPQPPDLPARWTPEARARWLLYERDNLGRPLLFMEQADDAGAVHVVGPDEDQPRYDGPADFLLFRRERMVCGRVIAKPLLESGSCGEFEARRLCRNCAAGFRAVDFDAGAAIFADNTEDVQEYAAGEVARIQQDKRIDAERAAERAAAS